VTGHVISPHRSSGDTMHLITNRSAILFTKRAAGYPNCSHFVRPSFASHYLRNTSLQFASLAPQCCE
jgi:hypothetical protein